MAVGRGLGLPVSSLTALRPVRWTVLGQLFFDEISCRPPAAFCAGYLQRCLLVLRVSWVPECRPRSGPRLYIQRNRELEAAGRSQRLKGSARMVFMSCNKPGLPNRCQSAAIANPKPTMPKLMMRWEEISAGAERTSAFAKQSTVRRRRCTRENQHRAAERNSPEI
jgi:hypothetical protein